MACYLKKKVKIQISEKVEKEKRDGERFDQSQWRMGLKGLSDKSEDHFL